MEDDRVLLTLMIPRIAEYAISRSLYARRILDFFFVSSRSRPDPTPHQRVL
jgi:hypothetical protein